MDFVLVVSGGDIASTAHVHAGAASHLTQLRKQILPFTNAQKVDELAVAHLAELTRRQLVLLFVEEVPQ